MPDLIRHLFKYFQSLQMAGFFLASPSRPPSPLEREEHIFIPPLHAPPCAGAKTLSQAPEAMAARGMERCGLTVQILQIVCWGCFFVQDSSLGTFQPHPRLTVFTHTNILFPPLLKERGGLTVQILQIDCWG